MLEDICHVLQMKLEKLRNCPKVIHTWGLEPHAITSIWALAFLPDSIIHDKSQELLNKLMLSRILLLT